MGDPRREVIVALALLVATAEADPTGDAWTTADYVKAGVPDPGHVWTGAELAAAVAVITKATADAPDRLPLFHGARSGALFARIVAATRVDASADVQVRFSQAVDSEEAHHALAKLYAPPHPFDTPSREMIESFGALFDDYIRMEPLLQPFLASFGPNDPQHANRVAGMAKMHVGLGEMIVGAIAIADQKRLPVADRVAMLGYVARVTSVAFGSLEPSRQRQIRDNVTALAAATAGAVHDAAAEVVRAIPP